MLMSNVERGGAVLRGGVGHGICLHFVFSEEFRGLLHCTLCTSRGKTCENKLKERGRTVYTVGQFIEQILDGTMCSAFPKAIKREFSK